MPKYVVEFYSGDVDYRHTPVLVNVDTRDTEAFESFLREVSTRLRWGNHEMIELMEVDPYIFERYWTVPGEIDGYQYLFPLDIYNYGGDEAIASLDGWYRVKEVSNA